LGLGTVKIHVASLLRSLGVKNRAAAAAAGMRFMPHQRGAIVAPPTLFATNYIVRHEHDLVVKRDCLEARFQ
jgi:hypothetical protein